MPGTQDHRRIKKNLVVVIKLHPGHGERLMSIYEISASFHKEAGDTLQGHNEAQAQAERTDINTRK